MYVVIFIGRNIMFFSRNDFLEFLEPQPFNDILSNEILYFRYIDEILSFIPKNIIFRPFAHKFKQVELSIIFTYELEKNKSLLFPGHLTYKQHQ